MKIKSAEDIISWDIVEDGKDYMIRFMTSKKEIKYISLSIEEMIVLNNGLSETINKNGKP